MFLPFWFHVFQQGAKIVGKEEKRGERERKWRRTGKLVYLLNFIGCKAQVLSLCLWVGTIHTHKKNLIFPLNGWNSSLAWQKGKFHIKSSLHGEFLKINEKSERRRKILKTGDVSNWSTQLHIGTVGIWLPPTKTQSLRHRFHSWCSKSCVSSLEKCVCTHSHVATIKCWS